MHPLNSGNDHLHVPVPEVSNRFSGNGNPMDDVRRTSGPPTKDGIDDVIVTEETRFVISSF